MISRNLGQVRHLDPTIIGKRLLPLLAKPESIIGSITGMRAEIEEGTSNRLQDLHKRLHHVVVAFLGVVIAFDLGCRLDAPYLGSIRFREPMLASLIKECRDQILMPHRERKSTRLNSSHVSES